MNAERLRTAYSSVVTRHVAHLVRAVELDNHVLRHGRVMVRSALYEAGIVKTDRRTGRLHVRKLGLARAALRPTRTLRRAVSGASVLTYVQAAVHEALRTTPSPRRY